MFEGWDASTSWLNAVRLFLQRRVRRGHFIAAKIIVETMDRQKMERAYAAHNNGVRPPLEDQLNDTCLGTQFREFAAERVGHMLPQQIGPFLPDDDIPIMKQVVKSSTGNGTKGSSGRCHKCTQGT